MRHYVYVEQLNGDRELRQVDPAALEELLERAKAQLFARSELTGDERGEKIHMTYLASITLRHATQLQIFVECADYFHLLRPGGRLWLPDKK